MAIYRCKKHFSLGATLLSQVTVHRPSINLDIPSYLLGLGNSNEINCCTCLDSKQLRNKFA